MLNIMKSPFVCNIISGLKIPNFFVVCSVDFSHIQLYYFEL
jgi:hypothetical protein